MKTDVYNKDTVDAKLDGIHELISEFKKQNNIDMKDLSSKVAYTNGKVKRHDKLFLVVGTTTVVLLVTTGSKFVDFVKILFGI